MKKILIALIVIGFAVVPSFAGNLNVSGRAGLYTPSGGSASMMYGLGADYSLNQSLSVRAAVETTSYTANNVSTTFTPVTVDLIYSQTIAETLHPYVGLGVSYNTTNVGGVSTSTSGAQGEAGIKFELGGFSAGVEFRYLLADLKNSNSGSTTYNAYATGAFSQSFNL